MCGPQGPSETRPAGSRVRPHAHLLPPRSRIQSHLSFPSSCLTLPHLWAFACAVLAQKAHHIPLPPPTSPGLSWTSSTSGGCHLPQNQIQAHALQSHHCPDLFFPNTHDWDFSLHVALSHHAEKSMWAGAMFSCSS